MSDCLFCKIAAGEIPSNKVYEDELVYAFYDIDPQAPTHFLVIPKAHIGSCGEISPENSAVVAHAFEVIAQVTKDLGVTDFRVVSNCGEQAGQSLEQGARLHTQPGGQVMSRPASTWKCRWCTDWPACSPILHHHSSFLMFLAMDKNNHPYGYHRHHT